MEMDKESATGKRSTGEKSAEITIDATAQHAWAVVKLGQRHHVMHMEHVRTEERENCGTKAQEIQTTSLIRRRRSHRPYEYRNRRHIWYACYWRAENGYRKTSSQSCSRK